jgi:acetyltransferase-like isoleucine patch superfamily enzyme
MQSKKTIPYYEPRKNLAEQIEKSSSRRKMGKISFLITKIKNHILESLAYNCPVNSWRIKLHKWRGVHIGKNVFIGLRCTLDHAYPEYIYLEDNVALAGDVHIIAHSNPYKHFRNVLPSYIAPVVIKNGAWITINTTILPGVTIGENSVIGVGVVVKKDVPSYSIVTTNKNRIIQYEKK